MKRSRQYYRDARRAIRQVAPHAKLPRGSTNRADRWILTHALKKVSRIHDAQTVLKPARGRRLANAIGTTYNARLKLLNLPNGATEVRETKNAIVLETKIKHQRFVIPKRAGAVPGKKGYWKIAVYGRLMEQKYTSRELAERHRDTLTKISSYSKIKDHSVVVFVQNLPRK